MSLRRAVFYAGRRAVRGSDMAGLVVVLVVVAVVMHFIWWIVGAVVAAGVVWLCWRGLQRQRATLAARQLAMASVASRADQQHQWLLGGDDRGLYGDYPPAATG